LNVFKFIQVVKMAVDQWFMRQRPHVFGWLRLRRIGRQEEQMESFRNRERLICMPSGAIKHRYDLLLFACSHGLHEVLQGQGKEIGIDGWQE
jgi:hypothetical protein